MDEIDLINKAKQGNKSAMNSLLTDNYPILKGYILKMTGNYDLAEDIIQDTLLKAAVNIEKFKPKGKFSTWLIAIATNLYRDYLRKNKVHLNLEEIQGISSDNLENQALNRLQAQEVLSVLQKMSYEKRAVFILKHYYNYKYEEIADILNCPIGTVRSRLHNCINNLIEKLERRETYHEEKKTSKISYW